MPVHNGREWPVNRSAKIFGAGEPCEILHKPNMNSIELHREKIEKSTQATMKLHITNLIKMSSIYSKDMSVPFARTKRNTSGKLIDNVQEHYFVLQKSVQQTEELL